MDIFKLINNFWEFCYQNPEKIRSVHQGLYFYIIYLNNKLLWKEKFGLPTRETMQSMGISHHKTYSDALNDLEQWGFIKTIQPSINQYSSTIIALSKNDKAALKHRQSTVKAPLKQSQSTVTIDRLLNTVNTNIKNPSSKTRAGLYVDYLNKVFGKSYRLTEKVIGNFKARIETDKYDSKTLQSVINNLKASTFHIDSNFKYCTPEFCLRQVKIEMYKSGPIIQKQQNGKNEIPEPPKKQDYSAMDEFYKSYTGQDSTTGD